MTQKEDTHSSGYVTHLPNTEEGLRILADLRKAFKAQGFYLKKFARKDGWAIYIRSDRIVNIPTA